MASPVDSGKIPLTFTFVPSVGTLPSEVLLAKESNYLPKIVGRNGKGTLMQKPEDISEKLTEKNVPESPQSILNTAGKLTSQDLIQKKSDSKNPENINHNDLFIAEFVVVMDDDEDEIIAKKSQTLPYEEHKHEFRETLQQSATWHPKAEVKVNELHDSGLQEDCRNAGNLETKLYKIKSSYKAFAAIPTNTLLLDQKAIDDPEINTRNSEAEDKTDTHTEMCSPALLRQQTEEICAVIDEVLHDPFPMASNSVSRSPKLKSEKKSGYMPRPPLKSAGRETKYATLQPLINTKAKDPQITRPGVIRPMAANESRKFYQDLFQQFSMPPNTS